MARKPIVTIDGPAGAGKSTVARGVARRLGLRFLDTGAMYRAFTFQAMERGVNLHDARALVEMIRASRFGFDEGRVNVDGKDVTRAIRDEGVTRNSKFLADPPEVRADLVRLQQEIGREGGLVTEGRDQGTVVFPGAEFKFYLDATIESRARRRFLELFVGSGDSAVYSPMALEARRRTVELLRSGTMPKEEPAYVELCRMAVEIAERDERDRTRPVGALRVPPGSIILDTTRMTSEQVCERVASWVRGAIPDPEYERAMGFWAHLECAQTDAMPGSTAPESAPAWASTSPRVKAAWDALTDPSNLKLLERWARQELDPPDKEAADRALAECRKRAGN